MNDSSKIPDLKALIGREIQILQLHRWGGQLIFTEKDPKIEIGLNPNLVFSDPGGKRILIEDMRMAGSLTSLLGPEIQGAEWRSEDRGLLLKISTGFFLEIINAEYIEIDGKSIIPGDKVIDSSKK